MLGFTELADLVLKENTLCSKQSPDACYTTCRAKGDSLIVCQLPLHLASSDFPTFSCHAENTLIIHKFSVYTSFHFLSNIDKVIVLLTMPITF